MIAAIYPRTSKENDDAFSISSQIDAGLLYAQTHGLTVPPEFIFREDFTGRIIDRPDLTKLRGLVRAGKVQAVIIYATDRLARRVSVGEILLDELFSYAVQLHNVSWGMFVRDVPEDRLRFNFETTFSGFERDKIVERTTRGKKKKASQGFVVGNNHAAYGYRLNSTKDNFETTEHARIAREILLMFGVYHIRPVDILGHLEVAGHPSPGVVEYKRLTSLYDERRASGRLTDEAYEQKIVTAKRFLGNGTWSLGSLYRLVSQVDMYAGKFTFTVAGESFTVAVPAIITEEQAEEVRKMRAVTRTRVERRRETKYEFLLARRLRCEHCKRTIDVSYSQEGYLYYRCSGNSKRASYICHERPIAAKLVDAKTHEFIRELLLNPRRLFQWWQEQNSATEEARQQVAREIAAVEEKVKATTEKYHRTLDRLTDNLDADEVAYYSSQRDSLKQLLTEYREQGEQLLEKRNRAAVHEEVITDFLTMGQEYREVLESSQDFTFWRGLVDDLDITAILGREDDHRFVEFIVFKKVRRRLYLIEKPKGAAYQQELIETQTPEHNTTTITIPKNAIR